MPFRILPNMGKRSSGCSAHVGTSDASDDWGSMLPSGESLRRKQMNADLFLNHFMFKAGIPKPEEHKDIEELTHELNLE
jgi:hypothetical protein